MVAVGVGLEVVIVSLMTKYITTPTIIAVTITVMMIVGTIDLGGVICGSIEVSIKFNWHAYFPE